MLRDSLEGSAAAPRLDLMPKASAFEALIIVEQVVVVTLVGGYSVMAIT